MPPFASYDLQTASAAARPLLEEAESIFGFVPNLPRVMAESPALLEGYLTSLRIFATCSLTPPEQQVVLLTASVENECHYCAAGHSMLAKLAGVPDAVIQAIRDGMPVDDAKLEALRRFTALMVGKRGWLEEADIDALLAHGYTTRTVLDVILGVAVKTMSNYTNHVAQTPLDDAIAPLAWSQPAARQ